jgi:hypothetical protein
VNNSNEDIATANKIQKEFSANTVKRPGAPICPALTADIFKNSSSSQLDYIMELTARFAQTVPNTQDGGIIPEATTANLRAAGISIENGTYEKPICVNMTKAGVGSEAAIVAFQEMNEANIDLGNDWGMVAPGYIGIYDTHYAARAYVSRWGYLALTPDESLYPKYAQTFSLQANESYTLHFGGKPPLKNLGFWSATMYDATGYLVKNTIDRYSVGDRSNLTYPDGTLVYGSDVDEPFEVLIQATQPPDNYLSK